MRAVVAGLVLGVVLAGVPDVPAHAPRPVDRARPVDRTPPASPATG